MSWWNKITLIEQILYIIATASTIILLIHTVFSMVDTEVSVKNSDTAKLKFLTIRGVLSFFSIGAWVVIVVYKATCNYYISFGIGVTAGLLTMLFIAIALQKAGNIQKNRHVDLRELIGISGDVYQTIPPRGEGKGKVSVITEDNKLNVIYAIAYEDNKIPTGKCIRVIDVLGDDLLLVESIEHDNICGMN